MTPPGTEPFTIAVADSVLADLHERLDRTRWPDEIPGSGWAHGAALDDVRALAHYWRHTFDWRAREAELNATFPGSRVTIDGLGIHYAHLPGVGRSPTPLLLLHGWPGSFVEMDKIVGPLTDPAAHGGSADDAFDIVVPSLPGHGFSDAPGAGFGADRCAPFLHRLMTDVLGYTSYGVQGGDRGAMVGMSIGHQFPRSVLGLHLNLAGGIPGDGDDRTPDEDAWLADTAAWLAEEGGYSAIQSTRPLTLAYGLHDSPVGLLAWIAEKWKVWSDCDGDLLSCFTPDDLLTNVTVYWVTQSLRSSAHWYLEHRLHPPAAMRPVRIDVPTGVAMFPHEVMRPPHSAVARKYDLRQFTEMPRGGHFAAMEQPELLVEDMRSFFRLVR